MIDIKTSYVELSYRNPVPVRKLLLSKNRFLKVTLLEKDYFLSTLAGFHESTLEEIALKVETFFSTYQLDFSNIDFGVKFFNLVPGSDSFLSSIQQEMLFHIESLLLGIVSTTHPHLLPTHYPVLINELYRPENGLEYYRESACLKIKITPHNTQLISALINELYKINPALLYRLDGNRRFEIDELIEFEEILLENIPTDAFKRIDYIEEPFKNFYDTFLYEKRSRLKIAIDDSFPHYMNTSVLKNTAVIKPSLLGISCVWNWLRSHEEARAIISSSFEHPTILVSLEFLAKSRPEEYHGLENFFSELK
jgi:hypothetical protein